MAGNLKEKKPDLLTICMVVGVSLFLSIMLSIHASAMEGVNIVDKTIKAIGSIVADPFGVKPTSQAFLYFPGYACAFGLALFYLQVEMEKNKDVVKNSGGNAKWYTNLKGFKKKYTDTKNPFNNMILTQDVALSMNSHQTRRNNNVLVVGGSGSGKTRFMIKPNLLQANCSFVITDPKGEILESEGEMLKKHGYRIKVFNLTDMAHSNSYNPFEYIRDDLGVLMMINCLIKNTNNGQKGGGDPFWEKSETALLQSLVFYLKDNPDLPKDAKNFTSVMKLLQAAEVNENDANAKSPLDLMMEKVEKTNPNSLAVKQYKTFKMGAGKTLKSILISCGVRLTTFNLPEIESLTKKDDLELGTIGDQKTALFVVIPATDDTYNFLVSMMYSQLFETLYYRAENECPYEYYLKSEKDVLAIVKKSKRGDKFTKEEAEKLKQAILMKPIKSRTKINKKKKEKVYEIKLNNFQKEFASKEEAEKFKVQIKNSDVVKGSIRLPYPVRFLLDEFANIGQIPDFTKKLATMRQYEISCTIILQSLAQIKTMYKDDWESVVGNCDSFLFLGGQEMTTLKYISEMLGKKTIVNRSKNRSRSAKGGSTGQGDNRTGMNMMDPNDIATMPKDECILIINGLNPFYDKKFDLTKHPHFRESGDVDPNNKFDCKKEIFNYGYKEQTQNKATVDTAVDKEAELMAGPKRTLPEVMKEEAHIDKPEEAVGRIILKKGTVIMNEKKKEKKEPVEFDYNIE